MLSGDLTTMPLADVLQWVDARGSRALVTVRPSSGPPRWLVAESRLVTLGSRPAADGPLATDGTPEAPGPGLTALTREHLLDLFLDPAGTFELREDAAPPEPGVPLDLMTQFLVMEGLRLLDEQPRIAETYPRDDARLGATDAEPGRLDAIDAAIVRLAHDAPALAEVRLVLGLSRPALLRRVDGLRTRGLVDVEGTPHGPDVEGSLIEQAQKLLVAQQYAEAAHVFRSLLATNPKEPRIRHLLAEAEREHARTLYARYAPTHVVSLRSGDAAGPKLGGADAALVDVLSRPRSVAVLVLLSPLRELETLMSLSRLSARGVVAIESAE
ncbi:MAG: DUF4388 domain-containing protein [Myxococcales bacterium]|nr:DUF4388 domain-containing protein [Myxococcales bacterium]